MMQDGGQDGRRNHNYIEKLFSDKYSIHVLHKTNVFCLIFFFTLFCLQYKLQFLFSSDQTMMQDGGQDGHLNGNGL